MRQAGADRGAKDLYDILTNIRAGKLELGDLETLNDRAIGGGGPEAPANLDDPRLNNAKFLVFRHSILALLSRSEAWPSSAGATGCGQRARRSFWMPSTIPTSRRTEPADTRYPIRLGGLGSGSPK